MKILAAVLIVTAIWLVLASMCERRRRASTPVDTDDAWMIDQHDPVVRLGREPDLPAGHPLARISTAPPSRRT